MPPLRPLRPLHSCPLSFSAVSPDLLPRILAWGSLPLHISELATLLISFGISLVVGKFLLLAWRFCSLLIYPPEISADRERLCPTPLT